MDINGIKESKGQVVDNGIKAMDSHNYEVAGTSSKNNRNRWMLFLENFIFYAIIVAIFIAFITEAIELIGFWRDLYISGGIAESLGLLSATNESKIIAKSKKEVVNAVMLLFIYAEIITVARLYVTDNQKDTLAEEKSFRLSQGAITILLVTMVRQIILLDEKIIDENSTAAIFFALILTICLAGVFISRKLFKE